MGDIKVCHTSKRMPPNRCQEVTYNEPNDELRCFCHIYIIREIVNNYLGIQQNIMFILAVCILERKKYKNESIFNYSQ